jgi:ABC-type nitrate/sulfonate/bicarbonate transport system ATPase subunit
MFTLDGVTFAYATGQPVFQSFAWGGRQGEVWSILGPSGCGKSTLLLLLAGLLVPQEGEVLVRDTCLTRPRPGTSLILQEYGLLPWATVRGNVELGLRIQRFYGPDGRHAPSGTTLPAREARSRVDRWLDRLAIGEVADRYPSEVSGGQRQRAAIARALVMEPDLLLMDEPFSALDAPTREGLQHLTLGLCTEAHLTVLLVTHSIEEAAYVGQRVLVLGAPPNRKATIIDNKHLTGEVYRSSAAYQATCARLRGILDAGER